MSVIRIASRYAKSLLDLAVEQNNLDRVLEDVQAFQKATKVRDFYLLLKSPIINAGKKGEIIKAIFEGEFDKLTMAFLNITLVKGREVYLPEIADAFIEQYRKLKNISTVQLTTATKLSEEAVANIRAKLLGSSSTQSQIEMVTKINPDLIGGFIIEFDDKLYDASVAHKLDMLKKEFGKNDFVKNN